jgi:hypothetical protein
VTLEIEYSASDQNSYASSAMGNGPMY